MNFDEYVKDTKRKMFCPICGNKLWVYTIENIKELVCYKCREYKGELT